MIPFDHLLALIPGLVERNRKIREDVGYVTPLSLFSKEDVLWFDVHVRDSLRVKEREHLANISDQSSELSLIKL